MDLLIEQINKALQIHCRHVSVQMCHTMRLDHTQNGDLLGSRDQAQNLSGCCVKVSITELTVPRFSCLSGSPESSFPPLPIPPLPLLWRKLNISGLHRHALLFSAPWLFPFLSLPGIEKLSSAHPLECTVQNPYDDNAIRILIKYSRLTANKNIHLH